MTVSSFSGWFKTAAALVAAAVLAVSAGPTAAHADDADAPICNAVDATSLGAPVTMPAPIGSKHDADYWEKLVQDLNAHMGGM
ncbi:hypothetical protein ACFV0L_18800 [Streptosporangium canum]|uniref:hypothetical protein n=1 Tax=Streptosporangium canum TaxID=324952 RepID=UPI0036A228FB